MKTKSDIIRILVSSNRKEMLIAILLSFCASTAFAQNNWNWGENFSWSVECDSATVSANGPDDDCWVYNDNEKDEYGNPLTPFLGVIVNLEQLQKVEEAYLEWDDENGNIGRDTLSVYTKNGGEDCCVKVFNSWKPVYGYDEIVNVPCVLLHRNCKNILKIKVRTVTVPPTIIHFVADDASEINKHPFYGDCHWLNMIPPIIVKCHRHCYDVYDHYDWDEFDTYFYYTSYEYDKYEVEELPNFPNTFSEEIDWGYKSCYSLGHNDSPVDCISFHKDDGGWDSQDISFNPSSIDEQGEYVVKVTYNFTEGSRLTPGACWGTNFQFDLDGGGSVDYTIEPGEKHFSISGKGIMGEYHTADEAVGFHLKIIPNPIKVLESVTVLYDSGVSDEIEEISVPFIFNEEGGYYELGELEDHVFDGALWIDGGWMNTIVVRFKDDDRIIEFADPAVKQICVDNWDTNGDGEISRCEAAAVTNIGTVFSQDKTIKSFDELKYFICLETLPDNAFLYCTSLTSITLPSGIHEIGPNALSGCTSMTRIGVADGNADFKSVDGVLFSFDGKRLIQYPAAKGTTYRVPDGTESVARDAFFMSNLSEITLPSTMKSLDFDAFGYSTNLEKIAMPEGLETISDYVFDHCTGMKEVVIPSTVTTIGQHVFQSCKAIESVYSYIKTPYAIAENNFDKSVYDNAVLYVPENSLDLYGTAKGWRNFAKIVGDPGEVVPEYTVTVPDVTIAQGGTAKMVIELNNGEAVVNGYQFEVEIPAGVELQTDKDGGYIYELSDRYSVKDGMQISIYKVSSQVYRVMASSMTNVTLTGTDGPVLMLSLAASDEIADSGTGIVRNIVISTNEGVSITTDDVEFAVIKAEYAMGDANGDGSVNVTDVMLVVNHILGNTLPVFHEECANMNGDSRIDVADVMLLVNMILSGETQAPAVAQFETSGLEVVSTSGNNVDIRMNNISEYTAFQMQVQMPSDVRLIGVELAEETTGHRVLTKEIGDGLYNVIVYSLNGENFKETFDGNLLRLVTDGRAKGIEMRNIQFTNQYFETVTFSDVTETTGIEDVSSDETDGIYYNLQGIPVKNPSQGVFIHDNKAILVK